MAETEAYMLQRDQDESDRLNKQSKFLRALFNNFVIHPSVPRHNLHAVADVGTGTGIWLEEARQELGHGANGESVQYVGFDISGDQFPDSKTSGLEFVVHDAVTPFPAQYHEKFDLVHLRFLSYAIKANQLQDCVDSVSRLIRPGGYLQWEEVDGTDSWTPRPKTPSQNLASWIVSERTSRGLTPAIIGFLIKAIQSCSVPMSPRDINPMSWTNDLFRIYHLETVSTHQHPSVEVNSFKVQWQSTVLTRMLEFGVATRSALAQQPGISPSDKELLEKEILDINNLIRNTNDTENAMMKERNSAITRRVARKAKLFGQEDAWMSKWHQQGLNGIGHGYL